MLHGRPPVPPPSLPGFAHIGRFHDPVRGCVVAKILPGQYYATTGNELIATVLGSCVSACIWDPVAGVGGMNHYLIPLPDPNEAEAVQASSGAARYGAFAMDLLIRAVLFHGGSRAQLQAKIVGGGRMAAVATGIGDQNIGFARRHLAHEGIAIVGEDIGGELGRRVLFHPLTGRAQVFDIADLRSDSLAASLPAAAAGKRAPIPT